MVNEFSIQYSAATDRGDRYRNQDNLCVMGKIPFVGADEPFSESGTLTGEELRVFIVCDGIGGETMGELAAKHTLIRISRHLSGRRIEPAELARELQRGAEAAQRQVREMYERLRSQGGCTLTMIGICGGRYAFLNVGDSPAFLLRGAEGTMEELSFRQNLAGIKASRGIPPAWGDERCLVNYIGRSDSDISGMAHIREGEVCPGDRILLCSDGVTNAFSDGQLREQLEQGVTARMLVSEAAELDGADNCTAICLEVTM